MSHQNRDRSGLFDSLSVRLFLVTIGVILLVEFIVFLPSAANYRENWLNERVQAARIAALSLEAAPSRMVSEELSNDLLMRAEVLAVAELSADMREQILPPAMPLDGPMKEIDMMEETYLGSIGETLETLAAPDGRMLVVRAMGSGEGRVLEVILPEAPLKKGLGAYAARILIVSLIVSFTAAMLIYLLLILLVVRPMQRVTQAVIQFRQDPGSWSRKLGPTTRRDEIGRAQNALADMEAAVSESFRQRERLAQLGESVAKINHDLRNTLSTAQLASDALSTSDDPRVQRAVPRLERALERAIALATDTLKYGRSSTPLARLQPVNLSETIDEAALEALGEQETQVQLSNDLRPGETGHGVTRIISTGSPPISSAMPPKPWASAAGRSAYRAGPGISTLSIAAPDYRNGRGKTCSDRSPPPRERMAQGLACRSHATLPAPWAVNSRWSRPAKAARGSD